MRDFLVTVCLILFMVALVVLIGTAGGIERDAIPMSDGTVAIIIEIVVLGILSAAIILLAKDTKDVTDVTRL